MNFTGKRDPLNLKSVALPEFESVANYMATNLITFSPEQSIQEAIDIMLEKRISGGPVLNERGELVGVLSEKDCLRIIMDAAYHNHPHEAHFKVGNYMSTEIKTVSIDKDVFDLANEFLHSPYRRFPVVDQNGKLKGQISRRDIMKAARNIEPTTW